MKVLFAGPDDSLVMKNTGADRKEGVHLSDITKHMIYHRDRKLNPESPIDAMVLERGFTWESVLANALDDRTERKGYRPEQVREDGIWMSPDWVNPHKDIQLEEWKATKKSLKQVKEGGFQQIGWTWVYNAQAYARTLYRLKHIDRLACRFRVWFINGDYSYEPKNSDYHLLNDYWRFDIEFDKRDLEEHWRKVVSYGQAMGLLKAPPAEEKTWPTRKSVSKAPAPSRGTGRIVTFPNTKRSSKRPSASS